MTGPAFRHDDAGTPENEWQQANWRSLPAADLSGFDAVTVVAAHPDDETLAAGGLLHRAARMGLAVSVLVATDGSASHPHSPTLRPAELARLRRAEVREAVDDLAPDADVTLLGLPDGELEAHIDALADRLASRLSDRPTLVVSPWEGDGHPDHTAAARAAELACGAHSAATLWRYPIWWWHWGRPTDVAPGLVRLDLEPSERSAKGLALRRHTTQIEPLSDEPGDEVLLSPAFLEHFRRPYEIFVAQPSARPTLSEGFFDEFYGDRADPWAFRTRWYEERKRNLTLAALPRRRFGRIFEPGCSIGVLSAELARRCDALVASDIAEAPLRQARARLAGLANVEVQKLAVPAEWPTGSFDCVVVSEVGYYLGAEDLAWFGRRVTDSLRPDGVVLACHWRHEVPEYPGRAETVHRALGARRRRVAHHVERDFLLDVWSPSGASVAEQEGLA